MRPIFTSPNDVQTQVIQSMLRQHGIETSLIEKKDARQSYNLPKVVWSELWLRDEMDIQSATTAITQFQFNTFRNDLRVSTPLGLDADDRAKTQEFPTKLETVVEGGALTEQNAPGKKDVWLPINNRRVFNYLASLLGMADQEIEETDFNKILRPWNSKSLMKMVDSLKQICS